MRQPGLIEPPAITFSGEPGGLAVDLQALLFSRLLIMASSGAGKGWMIRYLLEISRELVPQLVFDWEGEFSNLRDVHAYTVIGRRGDGADIEIQASTARRLCRSLMASRASVIVDLSGIATEDRQEYAALFLDELIELPQSQWHLRMVVIDEAQMLCPEAGTVASSKPVKDLISRGRKRGLGAVVATQRYAKLHKDATEIQARLAGRTVQAVDLQRVADELGLTRSQAAELRHLPDGHFLAAGAVFDKEGIQHVRAGSTLTKPPKLAMGLGTPTPAAIAEALAAMNFDAEAVAEDAGREELLEEIERLQAALKAAKEGNVSEPADIARAVAAAVKPHEETATALRLTIARCKHHAEAILLDLGEVPPEKVQEINTEILQTSAELTAELDQYRLDILEALSGGELHRDDLAKVVGATSRKSSKFRHALGALRSAGLVEYPRESFVRIVEASG